MRSMSKKYYSTYEMLAFRLILRSQSLVSNGQNTLDLSSALMGLRQTLKRQLQLLNGKPHDLYKGYSLS